MPSSSVRLRYSPRGPVDVTLLLDLGREVGLHACTRVGSGQVGLGSGLGYVGLASGRVRSAQVGPQGLRRVMPARTCMRRFDSWVNSARELAPTSDCMHRKLEKSAAGCEVRSLL